MYVHLLQPNMDFEESFLNNSFGDGGSGFIGLDEPSPLSEHVLVSKDSMSVEPGDQVGEGPIDQSGDSVVPQNHLVSTVRVVHFEG